MVCGASRLCAHCCACGLLLMLCALCWFVLRRLGRLLSALLAASAYPARENRGAGKCGLVQWPDGVGTIASNFPIWLMQAPLVGVVLQC